MVIGIIDDQLRKLIRDQFNRPLTVHSPPWSATLTWWWGLCSEDPDDL